MHIQRLPLVFVFALAVLLLTLGATALAQPMGSDQAGRLPEDLWTFQGMVFDGNVGNFSKTLSDVTVELYGSDDDGVLGSFIKGTTTNLSGWYELDYREDVVYEYYHILESDPSYYTSMGATTVSGTVISKNWIQISTSTPFRTFTGNRFWDSLPLLQGKVFEGMVPDESRPIDGVTVTIYCGLNQFDPGIFYAETTTDENGWYGIPVETGCDYYNLLETDPGGMSSTGAASVSGTVMGPNWIQYVHPLADKVWTGNKFWDLAEEEPGWLKGTVMDAHSGGTLPTCMAAGVSVDPLGLVLPSDPSTGDYGPAQLPAGPYDLVAESPGYDPMLVSGVMVAPHLTTTQDFLLERPVILVEPPDLISYTAIVSHEITYPLTITNDGPVPLKFELNKWSPDGNLSWFWHDPVSGTIPGFGEMVVDVSFHCQEVRDYEGALQIAHNDPCLGPVEAPIVLHCGEPPTIDWKKWVNGELWDPGQNPDIFVTTQTSDTITVVDVVKTNATFDLVEKWNPDNLDLLQYDVSPCSNEKLITEGEISLHVIDPPPVVTITKLFHVEPCTWTLTILDEEIRQDGEQVLHKPVKIYKTPPLLLLDSSYKPEVYAGDVATFTLVYSNVGGYENNVIITNLFPPEAPFLWSQPPPDEEEADGSIVSWYVGDLATDDRGRILVAVSINEETEYSTTLVIQDGIFNHVGDLMDEAFTEVHVNEPPNAEWRKWIDGILWDPDLQITRQTSDTIQVVDIITSPLVFQLIESWDPEQLALVEWGIEPPNAGFAVIEDGRAEFHLQEPAPVVTVTKVFHIEPCNWDFTLLEERLFVEGKPEPLVRPVPIKKWLPDLWIQGEGPGDVISGGKAEFLLNYGNGGGRENGGRIRNEFPPEAPFASSIPAPDWADPGGAWAVWSLPLLENGQQGAISVTVDIAAQLRPSATVTIWDGILNHARELMDETFIELHVVPPPVTFPQGEWPWYAQDEISVNPYPVVAGKPTEICVELVNTTDVTQTAEAAFSLADFGIGQEWNLISKPRTVTLPPHSHIRECVYWVPPVGGQICLQVELAVQDFPRQWSQRNIDVIEPLQPNTSHSFTFPVGNPTGDEVTITLGLIPQLPDWGLELSPDVLRNVQPDASELVTLTVTPPDELPGDGAAIVDVEAFIKGQLIGGFRKIFRPPVILHRLPDPVYAEREITVEPYPPRAGEPVEVCVELENTSSDPQDVSVQFSWANFGIGLPWTPIDGLRTLHLPPHSIVKECIHWVPPVGGHVCLQVELFMDNYQPQFSQRNIDVNEPLKPNTPHSLQFLVGNPLGEAVTITLGLVPRQPGWRLEITPDVLINVQPDETRPVTLTVTPPSELPPDETVIVDVEAFAGNRLIGGFRKIFRPPVPVHRPKDPVYAESEIFIDPYPPRDREPTEIGVELRNITGKGYTATVAFSYANFGIGFPFQQIRNPIEVYVPARSTVRPSIIWVPRAGGHWCIQVEVRVPGYEEIYRSLRNVDVDEPLEPLTPYARVFRVRNPFNEVVTITLGLVPHFPDWGLELSQDVLKDVQPGEIREVALKVTPPETMPRDESPVVDVEAYVDGDLIGGIRKIYRPPVPIHKPKDPVYAESEIGVDPYPAIAGQPTRLSVEVFNPTDHDQVVTATFSIAPFGIGLPFDTGNITPNPIRIFVPAHGAATGHVVWDPPKWKGKFCVKVTLQVPGQGPGQEFWSQRNIDVGEPLRRGQPHSLVFPVGNPGSETITVSLGLIKHVTWDVSLSSDVVVVPAGETVDVTLTVTPTVDAVLGTGRPIVDVEGFVDGVLIGGFRKLDRPPIPIHKLHEKSYAETEIIVDPYPPEIGRPTSVGAVIQNASEITWTVDLDFGWARFGMGIPFTSTGMTPPSRTVELGANMTTTAWVTWTPTVAGHQCLLVNLTEPSGEYSSQWSQRNVDVEQRPPCDQTKVFTFTVYNDSPFTATVDIGLISFNVPADWQITVTPTPTLELEAYSSGVVTVTVLIPCPGSARAWDAQQEIAAIQQASGSVPTLNVEGYVDGELVGGIQLQFSEEAYEPVAADFTATPTEGTAPLEVAFANSSTGVFDTLLWEFGDGGTSPLENPTHTFTDGGVYTVTLTAGGLGGTDVETKVSYITVRFGIYLPLVMRE